MSNGGEHGATAVEGSIYLDTGSHRIDIYCGNNGGPGSMVFNWKGGPQSSWATDLSSYFQQNNGGVKGHVSSGGGGLTGDGYNGTSPDNNWQSTGGESFSNGGEGGYGLATDTNGNGRSTHQGGFGGGGGGAEFQQSFGGNENAVYSPDEVAPDIRTFYTGGGGGGYSGGGGGMINCNMAAGTYGGGSGAGSWGSGGTGGSGGSHSNSGHGYIEVVLN